MYKINRTFFYNASQCHTLPSKHLGCLKIPDISSNFSKPSPRKEKRITLSFKTYLSVVSHVTADSFSILIYIGQGESPEQVQPKVDEGQSSAAGSRQHQLLQKSRQEVSQLVVFWKLTFEKFSPSFHGWKIHLCLEARRFAGLDFLFFPSFFRVCCYKSVHSWYLYEILELFDCCETLGCEGIVRQRQVNWNSCEALCPCISTKYVTFQSQQVYCVSNSLCYLCRVSCKF